MVLIASVVQVLWKITSTYGKLDAWIHQFFLVPPMWITGKSMYAIIYVNTRKIWVPPQQVTHNRHLPVSKVELGSGRLLPGGGLGNFSPRSGKNFNPPLSLPMKKFDPSLAAREKYNHPSTFPQYIVRLLPWICSMQLVGLLGENYKGKYGIGGRGFSPAETFINWHQKCAF